MYNKKDMVGIYKIVNPDGEVYIGLSTNIEKRFQNYFCGNCTRQGKLSDSLKTHGVCNHQFEILEECIIDKLREREKYWINYYDSFCKGLNSNLGGGGILNHTDEIKEKISKTKLNNPRILTSKIVQNYREASPLKKKVFQYDLEGNFIKEYPSINEASRQLNIKNDNISLCIRGKQKTGSGFQWRDSYVDKMDPIKRFQKPPTWIGNRNIDIDKFTDKIKEDYTMGISITKIAKKYNVHRDVIRKRLEIK